MTLADYDDTPAPDSSDSATEEKPLAEYEEFLLRELPPKVRKGLERELDLQLHGVEADLKGKLIDIFRDANMQLLRTFRHARCAGDPTAQPNPESRTTAATPRSMSGRSVSTIGLAGSSDGSGLLEPFDWNDPAYQQLFQNNGAQDMAALLPTGDTSLESMFGYGYGGGDGYLYSEAATGVSDSGFHGSVLLTEPYL